MGQITYCCGLHPKGSVILIAIVDIVLSSLLFLLSTLALADLHKVSEFIERDISDIGISSESIDEDKVQRGITEFTHIHGQVVLILLGSLISLFLSLGLFLGVRKDWDCPIKAWLINGCVLVLLGSISLLVLSVVTGRAGYLFLGAFVFVRVYENWVVLDFLRTSKFTCPSSTLATSSNNLSRSGSTERLHNV